MIYYFSYTFFLKIPNSSIVSYLIDIEEEDEKIIAIHPTRKSNGIFKETKVIQKAHEQLQEYFLGTRTSFDLPFSLKGTPFMKKVWNELINIPYGETKSYQQIAKQIGQPKACRAVGKAISKNPLMIVIPCHRVIGSHGDLTGFAYGLTLKKQLLEMEKFKMETTKQLIANILQTKPENIEIVKRLEGGRSNIMYVFSFNHKKYTFRIPGTKSEKFVDRVEEENNLKIASKYQLVPKVVYLDIQTGYKISEYIEGNDLLQIDYHPYLDEIVATLKKVHSLQVVTNAYDPLKRLTQYEDYLKEFHYEFPEKYITLKSQFLKLHEEFKDEPLCFCHGDAQRANWVYGDHLYLLDYEFSGMNDPYYDIACFGNDCIDDAGVLLEHYLGRKPTHQEMKHLYLWRIYQGFQWFNVAMYKEKIGLSKELNIDFLQTAFYFLGMAEELLSKVK